MKYCIGVLIAVVTIAPAFAHPSKMDGRWSTKKGNCSEEYRVVIGPKTFNRYEDICKITKETPVNPLNTGKEFDSYELKLSCVSEGEENSQKVLLNSMETNDQIKVWFSSDGPNTLRWLYRCKR